MQEKEKALQMAHSASSEGSFLVIMQPSHVYKTFYMVKNSAILSYFFAVLVSILSLLKRCAYFLSAVNSYRLDKEVSSCEDQNGDTPL